MHLRVSNFFSPTDLKVFNLWCFLSVKIFRSKIFRVHEHGLLNGISKLRQYNKTKQYIGGLSLASNGILGHFYSVLFVPLTQN